MTLKLLRHHAIPVEHKHLLSFHEHNKDARTPVILQALAAGHDTALLSDAGTPGVNDPGQELVQAATQHGLRVEPLPGPSAYTTALSVAGFPQAGHGGWVAEGWVPVDPLPRSQFMRRVSGGFPGTMVALEAPSRMAGTLADVAEAAARAGALGRPMVLAREMTKPHAEFVRGSIDEVVARVTGPGAHAHALRGEFTMLFGPWGGPPQPCPAANPAAAARGQSSALASPATPRASRTPRHAHPAPHR